MVELIATFLLLIGLSIAAAVVSMGLFWLAEWAWTNNLPGRRGRLVACMVPAVITCMCCSAPVTLPILKDNIWLYQLERQLFNYPLPDQTRVINREGTIRRNTGNGDYCIYEIRQEMATTLSQSEIMAFYENAEIQGILNHARPIVVVFGGKLPDTGEQWFTINIGDMSERFFDIRC